MIPHQSDDDDDDRGEEGSSSNMRNPVGGRFKMTVEKRESG